MQGVWALSGGIASGKSTVASLLEQRGAVVIDADQIARDVVAVGTDGLAAVVEAFGPGILHPSGELHREALGAIVFEDAEARQRLNGILHPRIFQESFRRMQDALAGAARPIFYDAALLVENGAYHAFDGLLIVAAHRPTQLQRLMARNQLSEAEANARIDSQAPMQQKVDAADFVIWNDGVVEDLVPQVDDLLRAIRLHRDDETQP